MRRFVAASILLALLVGCGQTRMYVSPDLPALRPQAYAILPFEDRNATSDRTRYPQAAAVVADALETAFLKTGYRLVERGRLEQVLDEFGLAKSALTEDVGIKVGKMVNADAVILGTVMSYYKGAWGGRYGTVAFSAKAVHVESGKILWKGTQSKSHWDYRYDPAILAAMAAEELVDELLAQVGTP